MRVLFWWLVPALAFAQGASTGLTVTGEASVSREPSLACISFRLTGQAEEAKDAVTKAREKLEKMQTALKEAEVSEADITVHPPSIATGQGDADSAVQRVIRGGGNEGVTPMVSVTIPIDVRVSWAAGAEPLKEFEKIAAIVDKVAEAGADNGMSNTNQVYAMYGVSGQGTGPASPTITFHVADEAGLLTEAYGKAVEDARARAEVLASKLGRKLGAVASARVSNATTGDPDSGEVNNYIRYWFGTRSGSTSSGTPSPEVTCAVQVEVQFDLEP